MPSNYRYPGKSEFQGVSKQGEFSDVNAGSLYRESKEGDLLGSTDAKFSQSRMADDHSIYDTSGK